MNTSPIQQRIKELIELGRQVLDATDEQDFDERLAQYSTGVEALMPQLGKSLESGTATALQELLPIHDSVCAATKSAKSSVAARIAALERNRPALVKYGIHSR